MAEYQSFEPVEHRFLPDRIQQQYEYHPLPPPVDHSTSSSSSSQLHTVRKPPSKPWRANAKQSVHHVPGAGDSRPSASPPKVYRVDPRGFRQLVQRLTGSATAIANPAAQQRRLRDAAPTPLKLFHQAPGAAPQQQMFFPPPPQYTDQLHGEEYQVSYPPGVCRKQLEQTEVAAGSDDNGTARATSYELAPQQQRALPSPTIKMATGCPSPGDWAALLSPSIFSAWLSAPLLSPSSMTPIETSTVN